MPKLGASIRLLHVALVVYRRYAGSAKRIANIRPIFQRRQILGHCQLGVLSTSARSRALFYH